MNVAIVISAGLLAAVIAFATNWLALNPWRRAKEEHWTQRARLYYPVRIAAAGNLWILPAVLTLLALLLLGDESPHWALTAAVTALGALAGTLPMDREVFPRVGRKALLRQAIINWLIRFLSWAIFLMAIALMPEQVQPTSFVITAAFIALCIFWSLDGWIRAGQWLGLFSPPPERLQSIVAEVSRRMNIPVKETWLMRLSWAQAFAMPGSRRLLFSERLLELLSDDELAAVCAHELAHLTESRSDYYRRHVSWLMFLPWLFFKPVVNAFALPGFLFLTVATAVVPYLYRKVSHRLEERADQMARSNEPDAGTYARALARIYEDNLLPAVDPKSRGTHPHLYDRLVAAGVTPEYPRPAAPQAMAWHGHLFAGGMGLLAAVLIMRSMNAF